MTSISSVLRDFTLSSPKNGGISTEYLKLRLHVGGTVSACYLALKEGWAINIGGGFHHASANSGGGFCAYADVSVAVRLLQHHGLLRRVLIVDLDAHQGNGYARDLGDDSDVYIVDLFNPDIYPRDKDMIAVIDRAVPILPGTNDDRYLKIVSTQLSAALSEFSADLLIYNAGTDSLHGDPLGRLNLSDQCVVERDEEVFSLARHARVPIAMLTSGGYQRNNAAIIAESIRNLHVKVLITLKNSA